MSSCVQARTGAVWPSSSSQFIREVTGCGGVRTTGRWEGGNRPPPSPPSVHQSISQCDVHKIHVERHGTRKRAQRLSHGMPFVAEQEAVDGDAIEVHRSPDAQANPLWASRAQRKLAGRSSQQSPISRAVRSSPAVGAVSLDDSLVEEARGASDVENGESVQEEARKGESTRGRAAVEAYAASTVAANRRLEAAGEEITSRLFALARG
mmetsp:Transcript_27108/g.46424  ORF Transcript_27108/g.46424 Transcript_27108/m.46424 type:complete len:208 (-) Transcript_27108:284-907(-)